MVERHFDVSRVQCVASVVSFHKVVKLTEASIYINCVITILSRNIKICHYTSFHIATAMFMPPILVLGLSILTTRLFHPHFNKKGKASQYTRDLAAGKYHL